MIRCLSCWQAAFSLLDVDLMCFLPPPASALICSETNLIDGGYTVIKVGG